MGRKSVKSVQRSDYDSLLTLLKEARARAGMTQTELAKKLNEQQAFVSKYESGDRRIDIVEFVDIAKALGLPPEDLFAEFLGASKTPKGK